MKKTKIDWCDSTWNPVTGCYHGCEYCYARSIATRFAGIIPEENPGTQRRISNGTQALYEVDSMQAKSQGDGEVIPAPYPFAFHPTLHRYRLDEPARWTKPRTIFVCSMADLFGDWVPDAWIEEVFNACEAAPQHRYLFLTKNPKRYIQLADAGKLPQRHWYGYSATNEKDLWQFKHADDCPVINLFISIEPILEHIPAIFSSHCPADWIIIGAETGRRKDKVVPKREWIEEIATCCEYAGCPVFMKSSLKDMMGEDFVQQSPWEYG